MHDADFASVMADALALTNKVVVFYAKYHILPFEERRGLELKLAETHREWARCHRFEQQHVDLIETLTRELRAQYQEWIQDGYVARKRWHRHPGEELNRLIAESAHVTAKMQEVMAHQSRKLSVLGAKDAWT
jgi:hypothetical protein